MVISLTFTFGILLTLINITFPALKEKYFLLPLLFNLPKKKLLKLYNMIPTSSFINVHLLSYQKKLNKNKTY